MPFPQLNSPVNQPATTYSAAPLDVPPITRAVYERVFRVVHGALLAIDVDPLTACGPFAFVASAILHWHHGVIAIPMAGAAMFQVDTDGLVMGYWKTDDDGRIWSDGDAFHCWLSTPTGWVLDFQAPLRTAACRRRGRRTPIRHYMFQRHVSEQSETLLSATAPGDFHVHPNVPLTFAERNSFFEDRVCVGLLAACVDWYQAPPGRIAKNHRVTDSGGVERVARLSPVRITGAW